MLIKLKITVSQRIVNSALSCIRKGATGLILTFLYVSISHTQPDAFIFKPVAAEDKLAQAWVTYIYQDFLGFMWIGTSDGLYRYDGYDIRTYRSITGDTLTLAWNNISSIYEDSQQRLWISTTKGISSYNRNNDYFYSYSGWPNENFSDIIEDQHGNFLFGSYNGLFILSSASGKLEVVYQFSDSSEHYEGIQQLYLSDDQQILINGPDGIKLFDIYTRSFSSFILLPQQINGSSVNSIIQDYHGTYWLSTRDQGLLYVDPLIDNKIRHLDLSENHYLIEGTVLSLLESSDSLLWIGTENNGIVLLNLKKFYHGTMELLQITSNRYSNGLANNSIYSLYEDNQGNIWIGTYGGLNIYNPISSNFQHLRAEESKLGLNNNIINAFYEEGERIWIATEDGINIYNPSDGLFSYMIHDPDNENCLSSNAVYAITRDSEGYYWFGTWAGGLNRYNPRNGQFEHFSAGDRHSTISNNNIFSLITDEQGIIWIGTMGGGLNKYDPQKKNFYHYIHESSDPKSISNNWVRQVFLDSRGRLWISTYNSLELMDRSNNTFFHFLSDKSNPSAISDNGAIVIFEDSQHNMWFGTETGLNLFNESDLSFSIYSTADGLPSNVINAILEDDQGNLWLSTNNGIVKFFNGITRPSKPVFFTYDIKDGLQGNKFNQRSALKSSDGVMYFGGKNGFNIFHPEAIKSNNIVPPVLITEFLVFNKVEIFPGVEEAKIDKHITLADKITLKYKNRVFTINFAALNYIIPEKNQYRCILEGFEDSWNDIGNRRSVTYTNLDPGEYTFKVIASNNSLVWNTEGAALNIIILPPWYRTFWAYLGYFILISAIVLTYRRFIVIRTHLKHEVAIERIEKDKLDQVNKMKTRFFTNISHEFRTPLTLILGPLENLLADTNLKPMINQQLNIIQKNARRLLRLINQLLDISEIEADHLKLRVTKGDLVGFIKEIAALFRWLAVQREIDYSFVTDKEELVCYFDGDKIEKICYNLIANAFKYTPKNGSVKVEVRMIDDVLSVNRGMLQLIVNDTGIGIKEEEQQKIFEHFYRSDNINNDTKNRSGIGLSLVKGLVNVYRGNIEVKSQLGRGTEFIVHLPVEERFFTSDEIDREEKDHIPPTIDIYDLEQGFIEHDDNSEIKDIHKEIGKDSRPVIMLVEDDEEMRNHLARMFSEHYSVLSAGDGKKALEICHDIIPSLVISDIKMPGMDGFELLKSLKMSEHTSHVPVILLTAKATDEDLLKGVSVGADAYFIKPFDGKLLSATVKSLIDSRKQLIEKFRRSLSIEPSDISITSLDEKFLRRAIAIVEKYIANPDYSVDAFSKDMGMSRSHLHRKFVGLTGYSPSGFIRTLRMKRAAQFLTKGQLTVSEILFEVGIKSRSYFIKSFKEQFGVSPTEFVAIDKEKNKDNTRLNF